MSGRCPSECRGFSLLEVMIALLILAVSLSVLLQAQAGGLANAARSRDMSVAALLARSKMIDIEQGILDEGFVDGEQVEAGDFGEEGHPEVTWTYRISEIDFDLGLLSDFCGGDAAEFGATDCSSVIAGLGGFMEPLTQNIANSTRLVQLTVEWPTGKYKDGFSLRTLLTRDGFSFSNGGLPAQDATAEDPASAPGEDGSDGESGRDEGNPPGTPITPFPDGRGLRR